MPQYPDTAPRRVAADNDLLGQMLSNLQALTQQVALLQATMVTRDDLKEFVTKSEYGADGRAMSEWRGDHAHRITTLESNYLAFRDDFHRRELADARREAQAQSATQQQIGQAQTVAVNMANKVKDILLGALASGFIGLLIYVATHSVK